MGIEYRTILPNGYFMKSILLISNYTDNESVLVSSGVMKKIKSEIVTFQSMGFEVDYVLFRNRNVYVSRQNELVLLISQLSTYHSTMRLVYSKLCKMHHYIYDYVYCRYDHISFPMLRFFFNVRRQNHTKVIAELPTMSKKWEPNSSLRVKLGFIIKQYMNILLPLPIDFFVTFSQDKKIYGIPAFQIENFVDLNSIPLKKNHNLNNDIHLIGVAMMTPSHGYDRIIKGLFEYYSEYTIGMPRIFFDVVGEGGAKEELMKMASDYNLEKYVKFHGLRGGKQLDILFDTADIGIGALAIFRKRCEKASELKIREYCARGLPFVYSAYEPLFSNCSFALKIPNNETPVDIKNVINFLSNLKVFPTEMRQFAETYCSCQYQFLKLLKSNIISKK